MPEEPLVLQGLGGAAQYGGTMYRLNGFPGPRIDPIHFAVIFLVGDAIGFITPPYGLNLYVASGITGIPYFRLLKYTLPYLLSLLIIWVVIALIPELSTILLVHEGAGVFQLGR